MSRIAYPYLRIPDEAVQFSGWFVGDPNAPLLPAPEVLADWDYARDLVVRGSVQIDWDSASESLQFGEGDWLASAQLLIGTGQGQLPRQVQYAQALPLSKQNPSALLEVSVPGSTLSSQLVMRLTIALTAPSTEATPLSPVLKGSRLWESSCDVLIEDGGSSRFPVSAIGFGAAFAGKPHEHAPRYVEWRPEDLSGDFSSKVVLYVNSDEETFLEKFLLGDRATIQAVLGGVASHMCSTILLRNGKDLDLEAFEEGSVGAVANHWLSRAFPDEGGLAGIVRLLESDPGAFNAALIASADVGGQTA
ncbi:MAG: hypothetical protein LBI83_05280 [Stenotrophomonas maltophilia]|jgi:hypothetical protein|nr:hypothetical protein [Stenotrophomonas maltophilia]